MCRATASTKSYMCDSSIFFLSFFFFLLLLPLVIYYAVSLTSILGMLRQLTMRSTKANNTYMSDLVSSV